LYATPGGKPGAVDEREVPAGMDAIQVIRGDHQTVEALFRRWEGMGPSDGDRGELVRTVVRELSVHAAVEEQILYPAMREALPDGDSLVQEALEEHQEAKEVLSELDGMDPGDPGFPTKVDSLIADVRHHVEEEENELLPKLESALTQARLDEMGRQLESAKESAPTRPHPHAPSTPPGNVVGGAVAGVVDRARDAGRKSLARGRRRASRPARRAGASRPTGPVYHVKPARDGGWRAEKRGSSRAVAAGDKKEEVVRRARERARAQNGRLVIHKRDGRIQEERSYGRDSRRSRG
jgi:hemerythrin superfamily protein